MDEIPLTVERQDGGCLDAALGLRRIHRREILGVVQVVGAMEHPDEIVVVDSQPRDAAERPFVRKRQPGPRAIEDEPRAAVPILLSACVPGCVGDQTAGGDEQ